MLDGIQKHVLHVTLFIGGICTAVFGLVMATILAPEFATTTLHKFTGVHSTLVAANTTCDATKDKTDEIYFLSCGGVY